MGRAPGIALALRVQITPRTKTSTWKFLTGLPVGMATPKRPPPDRLHPQMQLMQLRPPPHVQAMEPLENHSRQMTTSNPHLRLPPRNITSLHLQHPPPMAQRGAVACLRLHPSVNLSACSMSAARAAQSTCGTSRSPHRSCSQGSASAGATFSLFRLYEASTVMSYEILSLDLYLEFRVSQLPWRHHASTKSTLPVKA